MSTKHTSATKPTGRNFSAALVECLVGAGFFSLAPDFFDAIGIHGTKNWCSLAGVTCIEFAIVLLVTKTWPRIKSALWLSLALAVCIETVFVCISTFRTKPDSSPHFSFSLGIGNRKDRRLSEPYFKTDPLKLTDVSAIIFIPKGINESNVTLYFTVINNSSYDADAVRTSISFPDNLNFTLHREWLMYTRDAKVVHKAPSGPMTNDLVSFSYEFPGTILAGMGKGLPPIYARADDHNLEGRYLSFQVRAKGSATAAIAFRIYFVQTNAPSVWTNVSQPFVMDFRDKGAILSNLYSPERLKELQK